MKSTSKIISDYYDSTIQEFGPSPAGVDWNGLEGQQIRFEQLIKVISAKNHFSIVDLGCGYGALGDYLKTRYSKFSYTGIDLSPKMIEAATRCSTLSSAQFYVGDTIDQMTDYVLASGIFNVKQQISDKDWNIHMIKTLHHINSVSLNGFAFNCLTTYSDPSKRRDYLYYSNPLTLFNLCKTHFSRNVALLHDYNLYEFTVLVRKS